MKIDFINAQEMNKLHPETFEVPSQDELNNLKKGDIVKVCVCDERFWTIITETDSDSITATINNDLLYTDKHKLVCGDEIKFKKENIFNIY